VWADLVETFNWRAGVRTRVRAAELGIPGTTPGRRRPLRRFHGHGSAGQSDRQAARPSRLWEYDLSIRCYQVRSCLAEALAPEPPAYLMEVTFDDTARSTGVEQSGQVGPVA